jgi:hypothetical protein
MVWAPTVNEVMEIRPLNCKSVTSSFLWNISDFEAVVLQILGVLCALAVDFQERTSKT